MEEGEQPHSNTKMQKLYQHKKSRTSTRIVVLWPKRYFFFEKVPFRVCLRLLVYIYIYIYSKSFESTAQSHSHAKKFGPFSLFPSKSQRFVCSWNGPVSLPVHKFGNKILKWVVLEWFTALIYIEMGAESLNNRAKTPEMSASKGIQKNKWSMSK